MERDDERAGLLDFADEDRRYDDWRQQEDDEREMMLEDALNACLEAGVGREHLKTLARECGALRWALSKSLTSMRS